MDSGQVGWIYASHEKAVRESGLLEKAAVEWAERLLLAEVQEYDCYLTGECYAYIAYENGEETDCGGGYYVPFKDVKVLLKQELPPEFHPLIDALEPIQADSIEDILEQCEELAV